MKLGAIDVGTNTVRLLVAEVEHGSNLKTLTRKAIITRLGEQVDKTGLIKKEAIEKTIDTLAKYKDILEAESVSKAKVVATSAVRDAENAAYFLAQVKEELGFDIEILSGCKEAQLTFLGATSGLEPRAPSPEQVLVIDIGGGSTELILGRGGNLGELYSLDIGSVRLTEMFIKTDPPTSAEVKQVRDYINSAIENIILEIKQSNIWHLTSGICVIGVAGTITTLSAIKQQMKVYDSEKIHHSKLTREDVIELFSYLLGLPLAERKKVVGLDPKRADVIIAGTLILLELLEKLSVDILLISEHDILDGIILQMIPGLGSKN